MPLCAFAKAAAAAGARSQDRAEVFEHEGTLVVVVADGAGGLVGGSEASDAVVEAVRTRVSVRPFDPYDLRAWSELLKTVDADSCGQARGGETTAIVAVVGPHGVMGVSVGDSEAWVVGLRCDDLTEEQDRARVGWENAARQPSTGRDSKECSCSAPTASSSTHHGKRSWLRARATT